MTGIVVQGFRSERIKKYTYLQGGWRHCEVYENKVKVAESEDHQGESEEPEEPEEETNTASNSDRVRAGDEGNEFTDTQMGLCCEVLGVDEFDEDLFSRTIEKIIVATSGELEFHFYEGITKTARIQYFEQKKGKTYKYPQQKPFGYKRMQNGYEIIPEEAEAVKLMFKYYAEGSKIADISHELESKGYKSYRGKLSRRIIATALDSDFYIDGKNVKAQTPYELDAKHEPIVDKEIFETVQARRKVELKKQERRIATRRRIDNEKCDDNTRQPE